MSQIGLWDESARLEKLSQLGDSLQRLDAAINWEMFRPRLNKVFKKAAKGPGGRPPYDYVLLFKVLVLQRIGMVISEVYKFFTWHALTITGEISLQHSIRFAFPEFYVGLYVSLVMVAVYFVITVKVKE